MITFWIFVCIIGLSLIILFTKPGVLLKGLFNVFVENRAKTVEGANAVFTEAIEDAQEKYNKAVDTLQLVSGSLETQKIKKIELEKKVKIMEIQCENLVKIGNNDQAVIIAEEIEDLRNELEECIARIREFSESVKEAKNLVNLCESDLIKLKREKEKTISDIKLNSQMKEAYNSLDSLKRDTNVQKLLGAVRDGAQEKREAAVGAKIVHESSISTKIDESATLLRKNNAQDYVTKLQTKYGKTKSINNSDEAFEVKRSEINSKNK